MSVNDLFKEYGLEIDDIRWYLSQQKAAKLLQYNEKKEELAQLIWSKGLEDELYNMEESFIEDLQDQLERNLIDESHIREICLESLNFKRKRI